MDVVKKLGADKLAVITLIATYVITWFVPDIIDIFLRNFEKASQALIGLSISLIIFPFITLPVVHDLVTKAGELKININRNLVRDYVNACFTIFVLSTVELLSIIGYSLTEMRIFLELTFTTLVSILLLLMLITIELSQVAKIMYGRHF